MAHRILYLVFYHLALAHALLLLLLYLYIIAQKAIQGLTWPIVEDTNHTDQLGWYRVSYKTGPVFYPCRKCGEDEVLFMFQDNNNNKGNNNNNKNKMIVCYLGWKWTQTGTYEQITVGKYIPWSHNSAKDEERLDTFLQETKHQWKDPVSLKTEELAIRAIWQKVQEQETKKGSQQQQQQQQAAAQWILPAASAPKNKHPPKTLKVVTQEEDDNDNDDVASCADSDGSNEDNGLLLSPGAKKKEKLRNGDVISYYDPIGVAGKEEWLRMTTIVGIDRSKGFPLNLENSQHIDRNHPIRVVKRRLRGELVDHPDGTFKPVLEYSLPTCGTMELVGLKQMVKRVKEIREKHKQDVEEYWNKDKEKENSQNGLEETNTIQPIEKETATNKQTTTEITSQHVEINNALESVDKTTVGSNKPTTKRSSRKSLKPQKPAVAAPTEPAWKVHLSTLLRTTRENMQKRRRFDPSMTPEQLEVVLKVWSVLQETIDLSSHRHTTKTVLPALSEKLSISPSRLNFLMRGDETSRLSKPDKTEAIQQLERWVNDTNACREFVAANDYNNAVPSEVSLPADTPPQRKRSHYESSSSALAPQDLFSTPSRRRRTAAATLTIVSSTSRIVAVDPPGDIFRGTKEESMAPTPAKKRKAHPAFEPSSVTRRKRRQSCLLLSRSSSSTLHSADSTTPAAKKQRRQSSVRGGGIINKPKAKTYCPIESSRTKINLLLEQVKAKSEKSTRYQPHMTEEQLQFILRLWDKISVAKGQDKLENVLTELALECDVNHKRLVRFLQGDELHILSKRVIEELAQQMSAWMMASVGHESSSSRGIEESSNAANNEESTAATDGADAVLAVDAILNK